VSPHCPETILLARKSWIGLLVAIFNSLIVCAIGLRASQQLYSQPVLHLCIHIQHATWLKGTNRHKIGSRAQRVQATRLLNQGSPPHCGRGQQFEGRAARRPCSPIRFQPSHHKAGVITSGNFIRICITTPSPKSASWCCCDTWMNSRSWWYLVADGKLVEIHSRAR
jgi:hypothetical protein